MQLNALTQTIVIALLLNTPALLHAKKNADRDPSDLELDLMGKARQKPRIQFPRFSCPQNQKPLLVNSSMGQDRTDREYSYGPNYIWTHQNYILVYDRDNQTKTSNQLNQRVQPVMYAVQFCFGGADEADFTKNQLHITASVYENVGNVYTHWKLKDAKPIIAPMLNQLRKPGAPSCRPFISIYDNRVSHEGVNPLLPKTYMGTAFCFRNQNTMGSLKLFGQLGQHNVNETLVIGQVPRIRYVGSTKK